MALLFGAVASHAICTLVPSRVVTGAPGISGIYETNAAADAGE